MNGSQSLIFLVSLLVLTCAPERKGDSVGVLMHKSGVQKGYTLFTAKTDTYLINNDGKVVHQWSSKYKAGKSVYLLENGNLLRAAQIPNSDKMIMPSTGGRVELFDWDNNLLWEYTYSSDTACQHHDIFPMPNGNVLLLAVTVIPKAEAMQLGRTQLRPPLHELYNEQILELNPQGLNGAEIVWEWNVKDHLIQDVDSTRTNYGNVSKNPQRLDVNYLGMSSGGANWMHLNSIQYNAELDQIIMSSKNLGEIYIIDHSTSTAEAATNTGGKYGIGGDLLYRWGNPAAYRQGTSEDQQLFGPHYPHWIGKGLQNEGKIIVFNNGTNRLPGYSEVYILTSPTTDNGQYTYTTNSSFGPEKPGYIFTAAQRTDFYSAFQSSAQQLPNGNILICEGANGRFFEIDQHENMVWEFINPIGASEELTHTDGSKRNGNITFRATKYPEEYGAFKGRLLTPAPLVEEKGENKASTIKS